MPKRPLSASSSGKKRKHGGSFAAHPPKAKREVVFDPEARKAYLRGFSERKRQRRAFGLAMQKVKDRKAKLEERKQIKKDELKRVEEAEQQKAAFMKEVLQQKSRDESEDEEEEAGDDIEEPPKDEEGGASKEKLVELDTKTYDDRATETHWGGRVTVTTSVVDIEGDSSDEEEEEAKPLKLTPQQKSVDRQQQYAGKVEKYMAKLKGNMPGKKKSSGHPVKRKGKNGAADMKGIGGAANLKLAQKVLTQAKAKRGSGSAHGKGKTGKKKLRR